MSSASGSVATSIDHLIPNILLKMQFPNAEDLCVNVSAYTRVQDQVSTPTNLSVLIYSQLNLSQCLYTSSNVGKNEWELVYKIVRLTLSVKSKWLTFWFIK